MIIFQAFVGQKYGSYQLPQTILATDFEEIKNALLESGSDVTLLNKWYQKNLNETPNVYVLRQPDPKGIASILLSRK